MGLIGVWDIVAGGILTLHSLYFMLALLFAAGVCAVCILRDIFRRPSNTSYKGSDRIDLWVIRAITLIIFSGWFYLLWAHHRLYYGTTFLDLKGFPYPDQWLIFLSKLIQRPTAAGYIEPRGYYFVDILLFVQGVLQAIAFILGMLTQVAWPGGIGWPKSANNAKIPC